MSGFKLLTDENIEKDLVIELEERGFNIKYCEKDKEFELIRVSTKEKKGFAYPMIRIFCKNICIKILKA